jgi:putative endonuclease
MDRKDEASRTGTAANNGISENITRLYYVYMVCCHDGSFYTGYTVSLSARIQKHASGNGARYTRSRKPVLLVYHEVFADSTSARKREYAIKQLSRSEKESLIQNAGPFCLLSLHLDQRADPVQKQKQKP